MENYKIAGEIIFSISCSNQTTRLFSVVHICFWFSERTLSNCIIFTFLKILEIHRARNFRRNVVEFWRYLIHHRVQQSIRFRQKKRYLQNSMFGMNHFHMNIRALIFINYIRFPFINWHRNENWKRFSQHVRQVNGVNFWLNRMLWWTLPSVGNYR